MKAETIIMIMALSLTVYGKTENKLYLWFNGHRDGDNCPFTLNVVNVTDASLTTCAKLCEQEQDCVTFFYRLIDGTCVGCKHYFSVSTGGLPQLQDSKYFYETTGWRFFSSSRYILIRAAGPFSDEKEICVSLKGHLVNVGSAEENEFLVGLLENHTDTLTIRLGLTDSQTEGEFRWVSDDSVPVYTSWRPSDQPNDDLDDNDCVYMGTDGLWKTQTCTSQIAFVCEAD